MKSQLDLMVQQQIEQQQDQKIIDAAKGISNQNYEPEDISSLYFYMCRVLTYITSHNVYYVMSDEFCFVQLIISRYYRYIS